MTFEDCGTNAAYARHQSRGQVPCDKCKAGKAEYDKMIRNKPHNRRKAKARSRAQGKAVTALVRNHWVEYVGEYDQALGTSTQRQRIARKHLVDTYRDEYQELYLEFAQEELREVYEKEAI